MLKSNPHIYKGSITVCPRCHTRNHRMTRDCFNGEILVVEMFEALPGIRPPVNGEVLGCSECGKQWWDFCGHTELYLEEV